MKKQIYDEKNGMSYTLHGDYYLPDLVLREEEPTYGKYGMLRKQFLKEHRSARYQYMLLTGKLNEHLNQIDQEAREQVEMLMKQMAEKKGVTEELKVQDQMKWVRLMNNINIEHIMPSFQSIPQTRSYYFLHSVFSKMIITTTSTTMIPNAIYTKNAGKIFSSKPIVNARIAIIDIPIPIVLHNFFSSYFSFSSFEAVLYPEINQLPCPESKIIENTANITKTIHTIQSEPVAKSTNFIYKHLLKFRFS